jgi:diguanylate cyclase (GGDEF)-like protein/PAS domain S-box-containing protein
LAKVKDVSGGRAREPGVRQSRPAGPGSRFRSLDDPDALREFVRNLREGIYITSADGEILDANSAFLDMFGAVSLEELQSYGAAALVVNPKRRAEELELLAREGAIREFELQIRRIDGEIRTVLDTTYALHDPETGELLYHGILIDITARKELENQLRELSLRDPLTGCYNRRHLANIERQIEEQGITSWGCIFMDIDHFKQFNDRHGHDAGDTVLVKMGRFLTSSVRAEEAVVRLGGDEFLIVLVGANQEATEKVAKRLQLSALRTAPAAFSLGWAVRQGDEPFEKTIGRADQQLMAVRVVERAPDARRGKRRVEAP